MNAFGFGGINAHVVLEEAPGAGTLVAAGRGAGRPARPRAATSTDAPGDAAGRRHSPANSAAWSRSCADSGRPAPPPPSDGPCRLAVLGLTPKRRALAAAVVARGRPWRGRGGVWFTPRPLLARRRHGWPSSSRAWSRTSRRTSTMSPTASGCPGPRLTGGGTPGGTGGGRHRRRAASSPAYCPNWASHADVLAGHSLGEWTAMVVAGMYPAAGRRHLPRLAAAGRSRRSRSGVRGTRLRGAAGRRPRCTGWTASPSATTTAPTSRCCAANRVPWPRR